MQVIRWWDSIVGFFVSHPSRTRFEDDHRIAQLIVSTNLLTVLFSLLYVGVCVYIEFWYGFWDQIICASTLLVNAFLFKYTRIPNKVLGNVYIALCFRIIAGVPFFSGGIIASSVMGWLTIIPAIALLLVGRRSAWVWFFLSLATVIFYFVIFQFDVVTPVAYDQDKMDLFNLIVYGGLILIVLVINNVFEGNLGRAMRKLQQAQDEITVTNEELTSTNEELVVTLETVEAQKQIIEKKNQDITASITYAQRIQDAMMPGADAVRNLIPNSFVLIRPRDIVSGDFYFVREVRGEIYIAAVDCTGHGVPGAIMSVIGNSKLEEIIIARGMSDPSEILELLHKQIQRALHQQETRNVDGMDVALCIISADRKTVRYAGAQNPLLYIQNGVLEQVRATRRSLGGSAEWLKPKPFETTEITVQEPTWFYIYSDGLQDQFGGPRNRKFGPKQVRDTLMENSGKSAQEQVVAMAQKLDEWQGQGRQIDDILLMGFQLG